MVQRQLSATLPRKSNKVDVPPGYSVDESAGPMLRFQKSLPRLPVPPLSTTLYKYLETVQPHLTPEEFARTTSVVKAFAESAFGAELQRRLEARRTQPGMKNWLIDWWNDVAYMSYRDPVVVYVSYFYVHAELGQLGIAERAARLIKAMLPFRNLVETGRLEPEYVRSAPLCMDSYKWLFNASRYPAKPADTARKFDPATHDHIVFIRKNRFFEVQLTQNGRPLGLAELEQQITSIIAEAGQEPDSFPVGILTSENRDTWAEARQHIVSSPQNARALERIESAVAIICLDDTKPTTREELSWACWTGDGRNRWYDKHQYIIFENGRSGFLGEHSCMDGTPTLRLNEYMLGSLASGKVDFGDPQVRPEGLAKPEEIKFLLDDKAKAYIREAEKHFDDLIGKHELLVLHYDNYGKNFIKTQRVSPDAWVQLVKQLAFHKLEGRPGVCYESCQTRKYQLGRTEVIRSASNESKAWAESMLDADKTDAYRSQLFRRAVARHLQYATWAADGLGVDRHLFGLKKMIRDGESLPEIYSDPAYSRTSHWELSTSQLSSPFVDGWGYGEVVPDGYGLSYSIGDDYIRWTITSLKRDTAALRRCLDEAATETRSMMERAALDDRAKGSNREGRPKL
ncbi:CAT2 [Sanghuangporus vaninii]